MPDLEILTTCRFYLELTLEGSIDPVDAIFMDCKGFKTTLEVIEVCEVTSNKWGKADAQVGQIVRTKIPGNTKTNNLTLRRGMTASKSLWKWFADIQEGQWAKFRRDGALTIYDQASVVQARFEFFRAWPSNYTITDLTAGSNDIEIEELELACEEFKRVQ